VYTTEGGEASVQADAVEPVRIVDRRRHDFFLVDNAVVTRHGASVGPIGLAVYMALAHRAHRDNGAAWPSIQTIAKEIGAGAHSVRKGLAALEAAGLIHIRRRFDPDRKQYSSSVYTLLAVPSAPAGGTSPGEPGVLRQANQGGSPDEREQDELNNRKEQAKGSPGAGLLTSATDPSGPAEGAASAHAPGGKWEPLVSALEAELGPVMRKRDGKPNALAGRLMGMIGARVDSDVVRAVALWRAFVAWQREAGTWRFVTASNVQERFHRWAHEGADWGAGGALDFAGAGGANEDLVL